MTVKVRGEFEIELTNVPEEEDLDALLARQRQLVERALPEYTIRAMWRSGDG